MLSGYLLSEKELTGHYYLGLIRILITYLGAGVFIQGAELLINGGNVPSVILSFFEFKAAPYGWYIGLYIGLYLLVPFMNILWKNLTNAQKKVLLITLIIVTAVPCVFNVFDLHNSTNWMHGTLHNHTTLLPEYFLDIYPITFYFIGVFIKENQEKIKSCKTKIVFILPVLMLIFGTLEFFKYNGEVFPWALNTSYGSMENVCVATLIYCSLLRWDVKNRVVKKIIRFISCHSLSIYLLSYLMDKTLYHYFGGFMVKTDVTRTLCFIPVVIANLIVTSVIAIPFDYVANNVIYFVKSKFANLMK